LQRIGFWTTEAKPDPEHGEREEGADRVEKGIVRRSGAAGDEGLVNFVHDGIARGDGKGGDPPGPAPAFAIASDAAINQEAENKIFGEVGAFADEMVHEIELILREPGEEPVNDRRQDVGCVFGRERVGGEREYDAGPSDGRPPRAEPGGDQQLVKAWLHFRQLRSGTGIAPGLKVRHV